MAGGAPRGRFMTAMSTPASPVGGGQLDGFRDGGGVEAADHDIDRAGDLRGISPDRGTVLQQHRLEAPPLVRSGDYGVPLLGPPRHREQGALGPLTADRDRRVRPLDTLRLVPGPCQREVPAGEGRVLLGEQPDEHLHPLVELVETPLERRQLDAVCRRLQLVPAGSDPELKPPAGDDVDSAGHVGQDRGVPVDHPGDLAPDPDPSGGLRQRGQGGPALQVGPVEVTGERVEMVPVPCALEEGYAVGGDPRVTHPLPGHVLRARLDVESHAVSLRSGTAARSLGAKPPHHVSGPDTVGNPATGRACAPA